MIPILYLDTQDYINLFNEPDDGPKHCVLAELLSHCDRGEIVIGFSFATVMEFITKPDVTNRPERVRRGQLIKDICGPNAFPYPSDISKGASFPNGGMWMFSAKEKAVTATKFRQGMHKILQEELAKVEGVNRKQRRELGRRNGMVELIRKINPTWGRKRSDWGDFPVSDELVESRILERFMKGECGDREFEARINDWLSDPAEFSRIVYDYADQPNLIDKWFGGATDEIEQAVITLQNAVNSLQEQNEKMRRDRTILIENGMGKSEARKLTKRLSLPEPDTFGEKLEAILGKGRAGHFRHYLMQVLKSGHKFKRSDMMDLSQMCYAYDCDLFRCDKAMANTFRDYEPFNGKLVGRFEELPERIESLLERRGES
ncbi:MAG: hypothetical protein COW30_00415 [Rhodospirillales bacterium CG15_BIG_FIL_POST_REV_8_21_14_020_66_15]|nr:MAG: hypothetical protein COW30_00415 [Rhodospirillales bacterium CG15_BIG_FIL_POST_REV_8_21_14_020_66_15]